MHPIVPFPSSHRYSLRTYLLTYNSFNFLSQSNVVKPLYQTAINSNKAHLLACSLVNLTNEKNTSSLCLFVMTFFEPVSRHPSWQKNDTLHAAGAANIAAIKIRIVNHYSDVDS